MPDGRLKRMDKQTEFVLRTMEERDVRFVRLWFTDVLWPDFNVAALESALTCFASRERRYGLTAAQRREADRA